MEQFEVNTGNASDEATVNQLQEAVDLYQGDFLEGFYVRNAPELVGDFIQAAYRPED